MTERDETVSSGLGADRRVDPLAQVRAYWEGLRDEGGIPLRAQINPRGLEAALSSTFLIERVAPGIARFRIAGMDIADVMGMEVRGLPISAMFTPTARPALAKSLEQVFAEPATLALDLIALAGLGRPAMTARLIVLPLLDDAGQSTLALGCIALTGDIGRSPRRFDIGRASVTALVRTDRSRDTPAQRSEFPPQIVAGVAQHAFAEPPKPFDAPSRETAAKSYLRVVK
ncbi:PAS domain-containing protein [Pseudorhodobacter ferrugineus]|uniref:PAS domain-containing protein n=1 Tax=Pseudorhodobacter ferrugineus TaxID=77008 RepID=UPI0003B6D60A|nr:PAS domain-containing protein [Pseudorhodobacter ferrugineus]